MPKARFKEVVVSVDKLVPNPKNPRIPLIQGMPLYERLRESIEKFDYVDPIIWNKTTGMIVSGHQRFQVMKDIAKENGEPFDKVEVMQVEMSEREQDIFMVAVNKLTGIWDKEKLKALFEELEEQDLPLTGFEDWEIEALLHPEDGSDLEDDDMFDPEHPERTIKTEFIVEIVCKDEDEQKALFDEMKGKGYKCRLSM